MAKIVNGGLEFKAADMVNKYILNLVKKFQLSSKFVEPEVKIVMALTKAYEDGFTDGVNEVQKEIEPLTKKEQNKLSKLWDKIPDDLVEDIGLIVDLEIRNQ